MPEKLKILFITQLYPLSEDSRNSFALHYFVKEWLKSHDVQVIRPYLPYEKEDNFTSEELYIDSVLVDVIKPVWLPGLKKCLINKSKVLELIRFKPDVIFCHLYNSYLTFHFLKDYFKVPFVIGIHRSDMTLAKNIIHRLRIKSIYKKADLISYRSFAVKKKIEQYISPAGKKTFIAYSGIPESLIHKAQILHNNLSTPKNQVKKVLSVCRLIKLKQIDKVIEALWNLKNKGVNWHYTIIGEGPEKYGLIELANKLGLEEQVSFLGQLPREKVFEKMEANDYFVMPSYNETFGLVFLEAMANGCIVIGAEGWGIDGVVRNGENGFLCNPTNYDDLLAKVRDALFLDEEGYLKIVNNSLDTVSKFSLKNRSEDYLKAINI